MARSKSDRAASMTVSRPELLVDDSDGHFRELLYAIFAFSSQLQAARARFGAFIGLSPTQYMILLAIARLGSEEAGVAEIAERLYYSGAFVTTEVNKLVKMGLVIKTANPTDGRRVLLKTSAEGDRRLARLAEYQRPVNDALFASLKRKEFLMLHRLMLALSADGDRALRMAEFIEAQLKPRAAAS